MVVAEASPGSGVAEDVALAAPAMVDEAEAILGSGVVAEAILDSGVAAEASSGSEAVAAVALVELAMVGESGLVVEASRGSAEVVEAIPDFVVAVAAILGSVGVAELEAG